MCVCVCSGDDAVSENGYETKRDERDKRKKKGKRERKVCVCVCENQRLVFDRGIKIVRVMKTPTVT